MRQANSGSMGLSQYVAILQAIFSYTAPDVLIFGCGADSNLYVMANPHGQTIILEDNEAWGKKYAHLPIVKVAYESQLGIEMKPSQPNVYRSSSRLNMIYLDFQPANTVCKQTVAQS